LCEVSMLECGVTELNECRGRLSTWADLEIVSN
jgi:hypothetical protein